MKVDIPLNKETIPKPNRVKSLKVCNSKDNLYFFITPMTTSLSGKCFLCSTSFIAQFIRLSWCTLHFVNWQLCWIFGLSATSLLLVMKLINYYLTVLIHTGWTIQNTHNRVVPKVMPTILSCCPTTSHKWMLD